MFGALLLIERALPEYRRLGDVAVLAAGLASLLVWVMRRGTVALYAGAFLTAAALPGTIEALGLKRLGQSVEREDSRPLRGMITKVRHLVEVTEIPQD